MYKGFVCFVVLNGSCNNVNISSCCANLQAEDIVALFVLKVVSPVYGS